MTDYKHSVYTILRNEPLTDAVWRLVLEGDTQWITRPGQFVNIALEGHYLRRPTWRRAPSASSTRWWARVRAA